MWLPLTNKELNDYLRDLKTIKKLIINIEEHKNISSFPHWLANDEELPNKIDRLYEEHIS